MGKTGILQKKIIGHLERFKTPKCILSGKVLWKFLTTGQQTIKAHIR
jgi:hypothetical protein